MEKKSMTAYAFIGEKVVKSAFEDCGYENIVVVASEIKEVEDNNVCVIGAYMTLFKGVIERGAFKIYCNPQNCEWFGLTNTKIL